MYAFVDPVVTTHNEAHRFDAFFVFALPSSTTSSTLKTLLGMYTHLVRAANGSTVVIDSRD
jgi:hypothetical protein